MKKFFLNKYLKDLMICYMNKKLFEQLSNFFQSSISVHKISKKSFNHLFSLKKSTKQHRNMNKINFNQEPTFEFPTA